MPRNRKDMWSADKMASLYGGIAKAPKSGAAGKLAKLTSELYSDHVERLKEEINRRKRFNYYKQ